MCGNSLKKGWEHTDVRSLSPTYYPVGFGYRGTEECLGRTKTHTLPLSILSNLHSFDCLFYHHLNVTLKHLFVDCRSNNIQQQCRSLNFI